MARSRKPREKRAEQTSFPAGKPEEAPQRKNAIRNGRRPWELTMIIESGIEPLQRHPIAALSPQDRQIAHCEALGAILAAIALRKADATNT